MAVRMRSGVLGCGVVVTAGLRADFGDAYYVVDEGYGF
jgi:hypothetical protein